VKWTPGGISSDVEDRRGEGGGFNFGGGGFGGMHIGLGGLILIAILSLIFRQDLFNTGSSTAPGPAPNAYEANRDAGEQQEVQFVSFVLDDVQHTWERLLPAQEHVPYRHAKVVLFRDYTESACGMAQSATGPFYCPEDEKVYLDLEFFRELASSHFGAPGEFAQAYVIAHEVGHHVQKLLGIEQQVSRLQHSNPSARNPLSVRLELQADCLAGVWGHSTAERKIIDQADISAGLSAAAAVGDDRLQRMATGHVSPESFTHGTSTQRTEWFQRGLQSGQVSACNSFQ
jgi:predicted metalloprotease